MKWTPALVSCAIALAGEPSFAMPLIQNTQIATFSMTGQSLRMVLLPDSDDENLMYLVPTGLRVAKNEQDGPLFQMAVRHDGSADVLAVMRLVVPESAEQDIATLRVTNPNLGVTLLPFVAGKLRLSVIEGGMFDTLLGQTVEPVNGYPNADMPLVVQISPEGVTRLRGLLETHASILLALVFEYSFKVRIEGVKHEFELDTAAFLHQIRMDDRFVGAVEELRGLTSDWGTNQLWRAYLHALMPVSNPNPDDPGLLAGVGALNGLLGIALGAPERDWWSARSLRFLETTAVTSFPMKLYIESPGGSTPTLLQGQAGALLKGICSRYADLVYNEQGKTSCSVLVPAEAPPSAMTPEQPGTRPFDPFLD